MSTEAVTNLIILLAILAGLWLLHVLKQKNKSQKPVLISMVVLVIARILYYIVFNVAGPQALITVLINMILLGAGTLMLYVFAMSLAVLIIVEK